MKKGVYGLFKLLNISYKENMERLFSLIGLLDMEEKILKNYQAKFVKN